MAIKYLEKEKKVLNTEESIEHGTVAINYLEKILEKKKKKNKTKQKKILHTEKSIEHGTTDTKCESISSKLSVTTPPIAVFF